jgi:hypothetical protein
MHIHTMYNVYKCEWILILDSFGGIIIITQKIEYILNVFVFLVCNSQWRYDIVTHMLVFLCIIIAFLGMTHNAHKATKVMRIAVCA